MSYDRIALDLRSASTDRLVDESSSNSRYKKYTGSRISSHMSSGYQRANM